MLAQPLVDGVGPTPGSESGIDAMYYDYYGRVRRHQRQYSKCILLLKKNKSTSLSVEHSGTTPGLNKRRREYEKVMSTTS
jgi:hypothetical protein